MSVGLTRLEIHDYSRRGLVPMADKVPLYNLILTKYSQLHDFYLNRAHAPIEHTRLGYAKEEARIKRMIEIELEEFISELLLVHHYGVNVELLRKTFLENIGDRYINKLIRHSTYVLCDRHIRLSKPTGI
jgi:hypothetical protein